jgi:hypothetical protein
MHVIPVDFRMKILKFLQNQKGIECMVLRGVEDSEIFAFIAVILSNTKYKIQLKLKKLVITESLGNLATSEGDMVQILEHCKDSLEHLEIGFCYKRPRVFSFMFKHMKLSSLKMTKPFSNDDTFEYLGWLDNPYLQKMELSKAYLDTTGARVLFKIYCSVREISIQEVSTKFVETVQYILDFLPNLAVLELMCPLESALLTNVKLKHLIIDAMSIGHVRLNMDSLEKLTVKDLQLHPVFSGCLHTLTCHLPNLRELSVDTKGFVFSPQFLRAFKLNCPLLHTVRITSIRPFVVQDEEQVRIYMTTFEKASNKSEFYSQKSSGDYLRFNFN